MNTQQPTLDSREVSRMIGKRHDHLMRDIAKYVRAIDKPSRSENRLADDEDFSQINFDSAKQGDSNAPKFGAVKQGDSNELNFEPVKNDGFPRSWETKNNNFSAPNFGVAQQDDFSGLNFEPAENDSFLTSGENEMKADVLNSEEPKNDSDDDEDLGIQAGKSLEYFVPSFYADAQGKTRPCYLCTKKGCDLIANKLTGDKGIRFTVEYIERFEEMTKQLQQFVPYAATRQTIGEVANLLREARLIAKEGGISLAQSIASITLYIQAKGEPFSNDIANLLLEKEDAEKLQSKQLTLFGFTNNHKGA